MHYVLIAMLAAGPQAGPPSGLPPYADAIRCAALAEAAAETASHSSGDGKRLFDAAIFWGMAASEGARKAKLPAARFTSDQSEAAAAARVELEKRDEAASAELATCLERVPPLSR
jgi:hypothetical protein